MPYTKHNSATVSSAYECSLDNALHGLFDTFLVRARGSWYLKKSSEEEVIQELGSELKQPFAVSADFDALEGLLQWVAVLLISGISYVVLVGCAIAI